MSDKPNIDVDQKRQAWFQLLWLSPWIIILFFSLWHIFTQRHAHQLARANWIQDRIALATAFAAVRSDDRSVVQRSDPSVVAIELGPNPAPSGADLGAAQDSLARLDDDLRELAGAADETSKRAFLKAVRDCIPQPPSNVLDDASRPSEQCLKLIRNQDK